MFCGNCGNMIQGENAVYCVHCGAKIKKDGTLLHSFLSTVRPIFNRIKNINKRNKIIISVGFIVFIITTLIIVIITNNSRSSFNPHSSYSRGSLSGGSSSSNRNSSLDERLFGIWEAQLDYGRSTDILIYKFNRDGTGTYEIWVVDSWGREDFHSSTLFEWRTSENFVEVNFHNEGWGKGFNYIIDINSHGFQILDLHGIIYVKK
ncbi:MAG: hypothetical protein FWD90_02870 [Defluviitaleaceae bacterium]|nr:hypothetical protein [Defluviitaleaceae bacterium]